MTLLLTGSFLAFYSLSGPVQFVPEVELTALGKVRAKQQKDTTPGSDLQGKV